MTRTTLPFRTLAAVYLAMGVVPLANLISASEPVRWWHGAAVEWAFRGTALVLIALLVALVLRDGVDAVIDAASRWLMRPGALAFAAGASIVAVILSAALSRYCFSGMPFTSDEMAQQLHARIMLSGHLAGNAENAREFFNTAPVYDANGRWFSQYPVGGPAFIALGMAFNAAWLVNPLLLGLATWQLHRFLRVTAGEVSARVVTLLFVTSPMVLVMGASQMNHVPALAFTLLALAELARWDADAPPIMLRRHAVFVGLAIGVVALVRPLDAFIVALLVGAFQAWRAYGQRERWTSMAWGVAAGTIAVALLLWVNARTTGHPFLFGYEAVNGPEHSIGFHLDPNDEYHTPKRGLMLASGYLMRLSRYLFEWPIPAVLAIAAGLAAVRRPTRWDGLLAALSFAFVAAYGAYWFDGFFAGPRFLFTAVPAFVYFAARAPAWIAERTTRVPDVRRALYLLLPMCVATAWFGPSGVSSARARVASYNEQRTKLKTDVDAQLRRDGIHNALVFVNEGWRGRLQARLRILGVSQFRAERTLSSVDACALQSALDSADVRGDPDLHARAERAIASAAAFGRPEMQPRMQADQAIALVPGSRPTPSCIREFARDQAGTISLPIFLERQHFDRDGRIGGDVVFAREMGARDSILLRRFGNRVWYRYVVPNDLGDTTAAFRPYERELPQ